VLAQLLEITFCYFWLSST